MLRLRLSLQNWFLCIRPKTLLASVGPVLLGLSLAYGQGHQLDVVIALTTLLSCLFLQIGANLVNDYHDYKSGVDHSGRLGPTRMSQSGLIPAEKVKLAYQLSFSLGTVLGFYLIYHGGAPIALIGFFSLIFAYAYTAGPLPLSHLGLGEALAVFFFGPVAVCGTYYLQTLTFDWTVFLAGLGPGLISAAMMAINNLRDRESDRQSGKKTFAVRFGELSGRYLCLVFIMAASTVPLLYMILKNGHILLSVAALSFLLFFNFWKDVYHAEIGPHFNHLLAGSGKFLLVYSLLFSLGVLAA